ncbi:MAG: hypothetical protein ACPG8W_14140, partial [Candidatus Promineifilaceae bacterium]
RISLTYAKIAPARRPSGASLQVNVAVGASPLEKLDNLNLWLQLIIDEKTKTSEVFMHKPV